MSLGVSDAELASVLLTIDPAGLKGAIVRGSSRGACEAWIDRYVGSLPASAPIRRIPANISDDRLVGGLDFAATIAAGRAVAERGVLAAAEGGAVILSAATTRPATWSHVVRVLDAGSVRIERDGLAESHNALFTVVVAQTDDDDAVPGAVSDRLAFVVTAPDAVERRSNSSRTRLSDAGTMRTPRALADMIVGGQLKTTQDHGVQASGWALANARARVSAVRLSDEMITALCNAAQALGVLSTRVTLSALAAARAHAALHGRVAATEDDLACAARLVLAPRATSMGEVEQAPDVAQQQAPSESAPDVQMQAEHPAHAADDRPPRDQADDAGTVKEMSDVIIRAAQSAIPSGLIAASAARSARGSGTSGRAGAERVGVRGRQVGTRRGRPTGGARLDLVATLRAAAPMQRVRQASRDHKADGVPVRVVELRQDDFRVRRCVTPSPTTTVFIVDASGSAALHRLAEAKGAMELMLAEGYARRERVAVIAFRGTSAALVLPPTHALARARRAVAGMPAGGGTPLASALDLAVQVVTAARRDVSQVITVLLTDGRANVARDGTGGRPRAQAEALESARRFATLGGDIVLVDTAPRPDAFARELAKALAARYVPLPVPTATGVRDVALAVRGAPESALSHG